jgi:4-amino-4-deoxy-L-arabinose transferase-like glycosyltransferase
MTESRPWGMADLAGLLIVLAVAGEARFWYVAVCTEGGNGAPLLQVQGYFPQLDTLVHNIDEQRWFACRAPLADQDETTAHVAPAYPWLVSLIGRMDVSVPAVMRWGQAVLGTLTAAGYFLFARRAFQSLFAGFLAGILTALHPFWIINTGELNDGVLATFLLAATLMLGTRAAQSGGVLSSLLFGLALAGLALTRAALLPFVVVALVWFLLRCRQLRSGWQCAVLAVLGFGNALAPWTVRNFQDFQQPVPLVDSAMLHLWIGNNAQANGANMDEAALRKSLPGERIEELLAEPNQAKRYNSLAPDVIKELATDPGATLSRRLWASFQLVFGENWFKNKTFAEKSADADAITPPEWLATISENALGGSLLAMLALGILGWRFSFGWRKYARLGTLAAIWIPLPYILGHADTLTGPRLPLDGVWLTFAAFAIACGFPGVRRQPK